MSRSRLPPGVTHGAYLTPACGPPRQNTAREEGDGSKRRGDSVWRQVLAGQGPGLCNLMSELMSTQAVRASNMPISNTPARAPGAMPVGPSRRRSPVQVRSGSPPPRTPSELSAGEGEMGDAAGRADRLNVEALLEFLEPVPKAFSACENDGHDRDVHVVDQIGREELANCGRSSANPDV